MGTRTTVAWFLSLSWLNGTFVARGGGGCPRDGHCGGGEGDSTTRAVSCRAPHRQRPRATPRLAPYATALPWSRPPACPAARAVAAAVTATGVLKSVPPRRTRVASGPSDGRGALLHSLPSLPPRPSPLGLCGDGRARFGSGAVCTQARCGGDGGEVGGVRLYCTLCTVLYLRTRRGGRAQPPSPPPRPTRWPAGVTASRGPPPGFFLFFLLFFLVFFLRPRRVPPLRPWSAEHLGAACLLAGARWVGVAAG